MKKHAYAQSALDYSLEELSILSTIISGGKEFYLECSDIVSEQSFDSIPNKIVYESISSLFNEGKDIGYISVLSKSIEMGLDKNDNVFKEILGAPKAPLNSLRDLAQKLKKRLVIREAISLHRKSIDELSKMSPSEDITKIFSVSESALFDLITKFTGSSDNVIEIKDVVKTLVDYFKENPSENVGIPTPWPKFNQSIGGGMRTGVTLIGARSGVGKTNISLVTANYLGSLDIPVLILDTEMEYKDVLPRMIANLSNVSINEIERGAFANNSLSNNLVYNAVSELEKYPIYYKTIAGKSFDEILSIIRRWIYKDVGLTKTGRANQCLIIYDYFKIMDSADISDMAEFQAMGFQISKLTDFCKMYDVPCLSFVQLNRDGVSKEGTDVIAQSDRLLWLCNSFSIFKLKSDLEMEKDGYQNGNRKLITLKSRYGGEHTFGEYISMNFRGDTCSLLEVTTKTNHATGSKVEVSELSE